MKVSSVCSKCNKPLAFNESSRTPKIRGWYFGTVCTACGEVRCPDCGGRYETPCPKCNTPMDNAFAEYFF